MALLRTVPRVLAVLVFVVHACPARAGVLNVPGEYATIQQAIDAADDGDLIVVAPGTYSGPGNVELNSLGRDLTIRSQDGPDSCILDAQHLGRHFVFETGETSDFLIDGFTMRNGSAWESESAVGEGGAVLCDNGSSPLFRNCRFVRNEAFAGGAVIATSSSHPRFENCTFGHNRATWGGALGVVDFSSPSLHHCSFTNNSARIGGAIVGWFGWYFSDDSGPDIDQCEFAGNHALDTVTMPSAGGALYLFRSYPYVSRCIFRGNRAEGAGGALHGHKSNPLLVSCLFVDNEAVWAGACYNDPFSVPAIVNCTIVNNRAKLAAGGLWSTHLGATIANCVLWGNHASTGDGDQMWGSSFIFNSVVEGGWPDGWEISQENPQFLDPKAGDFRVSRRSPCVNLGFMYYVPDDAELDLAGNARVVCDAIDAGSFEVQLARCGE